jgi:hypothetical protein
VALVCLALALSPQWDEQITPATGQRVSEMRLGLWSSPAYHAVRRESPDGFSWRGGINWFSWSSLLVVVGIACLEACRQRQAVMGRSAAAHGAKSPKEASAETGRRV